MLTIIESPLFTKLWPDYWSEEERGEFATFIANFPESGISFLEAGAAERSGGLARALVNVAECESSIPHS